MADDTSAPTSKGPLYEPGALTAPEAGLVTLPQSQAAAPAESQTYSAEDADRILAAAARPSLSALTTPYQIPPGQAGIYQPLGISPNPAAIPLIPPASMAMPKLPPAPTYGDSLSSDQVDKLLREGTGPLDRPPQKSAIDWGLGWNLASDLIFPGMESLRSLSNSNFGRDMAKGILEKAPSIISGAYSVAQAGVDALAVQQDPGLFYSGKTEVQAQASLDDYKAQLAQLQRTYAQARDTGQLNSQGSAVLSSGVADLQNKVDAGTRYLADLRKSGAGTGTYQTRNPVAWALSGAVSPALGFMADLSHGAVQKIEQGLPTPAAFEAGPAAGPARTMGALPFDIAAISTGLGVPDFALEGFEEPFRASLQNGATLTQARLAGLMGMAGGTAALPLMELAGGSPKALPLVQEWAKVLAGRPVTSVLADMSASAAKMVGFAEGQNAYNNLVSYVGGYDHNRPLSLNAGAAAVQGLMLEGLFAPRFFPRMSAAFRSPDLGVRTIGGAAPVPPAPVTVAGPGTPIAPPTTVGETLTRPPPGAVPEGGTTADHLGALEETLQTELPLEGAAASVRPTTEAAPTGERFVPSKEYQHVPDWAVLPPGGEYRVNMATGAREARWTQPPGPETVFDQRSKTFQNAAPTAPAPAPTAEAPPKASLRGDMGPLDRLLWEQSLPRAERSERTYTWEEINSVRQHAQELRSKGYTELAEQQERFANGLEARGLMSGQLEPPKIPPAP